MSPDIQLRAAVLGLGIMGEAIACNLDQAGLLGAAWNRSPRPEFPRYTPVLRDALKSCEFLFILVTDDQAVADVINNMEADLGPQHLIIQCSTVNPESNIRFQGQVEKRGTHFIEALIGGSKIAALDRQIILYTGGDAAQAQRAEPVLAAISAKRIYIGETGKASAVKLAMNLNIAMQVESLCESFAYAERAGIDADTFFTVLKNNTAWNRLSDVKEPKLRRHEFSPQFSVKNMLKDIRLALATDKTDHGLKLLAAVENIYARAEAGGLGHEDMTALYKLLNNQRNRGTGPS
jgi:3-hydroxyisobutyrate dehydrogenase-like beta-hydroxyacid dehydrogenase